MYSVLYNIHLIQYNVCFICQGRFEILSLSGSFLLSENSGQRSRTGGLSVSLSGPDGRVLGGGVAGLLMAASPVQVLMEFIRVCNLLAFTARNNQMSAFSFEQHLEGRKKNC